MKIPFGNLRDLPDAENAFWVGGSVRDCLLGRRPQDYDIAVFPPVRRFAEALARRLGGHCVPLGKPGLQIIRVVSEGVMMDVSPVNGPTIEADLAKRDFTVNALACRLTSRAPIDCTGGLEDLGKKTIRMVSPSALAADPVRLLRAYRLAAQLGFRIAPDTSAAIAAHAPLIRTSAGERIHMELFKLLAVDRAFPWLSQMARDRLLFSILPELAPLKGCRQNRHHRFDAWEHTLKAFEALEAILVRCDTLLAPETKGLSESLKGDVPALLKFAVLLHDIGKPATRRAGKGGEAVFHGHPRKGAEMAEDAAARLRCSARETHVITGIIRRHLLPLLLFIHHEKNRARQRSVARFFMKSGRLSPLILLHALADHRGKQRRTASGEDDFTRFVRRLLTHYFTEFQRKMTRPTLVTGHDLMSEFGLRPGPQFKSILNRVEEARLSGEAATREEGLRIAAEFIRVRGFGLDEE